MRSLLLGSLGVVCLAATVQAQLRLPALPLGPGSLAPLASALNRSEPAVPGLGQARRLAAASLLRNDRRWVGADPQGNPVVRDEVLAYHAPGDLPEAVLKAGFTILRAVHSEALGLTLCVLAPPPRVSTRSALGALKSLDPAGQYDYNHLYLGGGQLLQAQAGGPGVQTPDAPTLRAVRVGLIDTGVDQAHPAFRDARIRAWGCGGRPQGAAHGTAVASLMVGRSPPFQGVLPAAELYAADIYCGEPTGGAVDSLIGALGWLAQERVPVINVSLVGPANALLERAVATLLERGFVLVAAVGNDGPAAPPLYPAAYPGVVGVSAVDARLRVLLEAARGPQVMFAAVGADTVAAAGSAGYASARGTSFAAPVVAVLLATQLISPARDAAAAAVEALAGTAQRPGGPGRDLTYGYGIVGAQYRNDPQIFLHH